MTPPPINLISSSCQTHLSGCWTLPDLPLIRRDIVFRLFPKHLPTLSPTFSHPISSNPISSRRPHYHLFKTSSMARMPSCSPMVSQIRARPTPYKEVTTLPQRAFCPGLWTWCSTVLAICRATARWVSRRLFSYSLQIR